MEDRRAVSGVDRVDAGLQRDRARVCAGDEAVQARALVVADARVYVGAAVERLVERDAAGRRLLAPRRLDLTARLGTHRVCSARDQRRRAEGERDRTGDERVAKPGGQTEKHSLGSYYAADEHINFCKNPRCLIASMILCAGLGTRLKPLTDWRAKPLVPVGDRPALAHVLDVVRAAGAERVVVNAHHRADEVLAFVAARDASVAVSEEIALLGTAGGVARAAELLGAGDVLIWNGDILAPMDPSTLAALHAAAHGTREATLVVQPRTTGEGNVGVDAQGRVVRLRRETIRDGEVRGGDFLGIHVIGSTLRATLPERGCLVGDVYLPALRRGASIAAHWFEGAWWDVGTIESYRAANLSWLDARGLRSWVAESASVSDAVTLDRCVIGERAKVEGSGLAREVIVWPGATLTAPATRAVASAQGVAAAL